MRINNHDNQGCNIDWWLIIKIKFFNWEITD